ncbi:MAG: hypothetical protein R3231_01160 [bacterium]|nr:hypothetical protein [bacterium]
MADLAETSGVVAYFVGPRREGIIFVAYPVTETNSADFLRTVKGLDSEAHIIGD